MANRSTVRVVLSQKGRGAARADANVPPAFIDEIKDVEVTEGGRARFECRVEGTPTPKVTWEKNGELVTASSRVRVSDMYGANSLIISRTEHADTGVYTAIAINNSGRAESAASLNLKESAYDTTNSNKSRRTVNSNSASYSSSPATSNISSPSESPKLGRKSNMPRGAPVNVSPWNVDLKSRSGASGTPPRRRAPGFILRPRAQTVEVGEKLILKCSLLGHPQPTVTWEKEFRKVDETTTNGRVITRSDGSDYYFEIAEVVATDGGKYTVTAKNNLGKQSAVVDITIAGTGTGRLGNGYKNRRDEKNDMDDTINNNKTKTTRIEITSRRTNNDVNGGLHTNKVSTKTFEKEPIKSETTFKYSSRSPDKEPTTGKSKRSAPTFLKRLASTQVLEGGDLVLSCEIQGSPTPALTWTKNGVPVSVGSDVVSSDFSDGHAFLEIKNVSPSHAGEYICIAKNTTGESKCSSRVTVKGKAKQIKPEFSTKLKDMRITEGETLTLEAEVTGYPDPEVLWSIDGQEIENAEMIYKNNIAKLVLRDVTYDSSGQYMCTAMNEHGEDSVACRVRIKQKKVDFPPEFSSPLSDCNVQEGQDIAIHCSVSGTPEPKIKWLYNDEVLEEEDGIEFSFSKGNAKLFIDHATSEDTGYYTCLAVNSAGKATTSCQVIVKERKKREELKAPKFTSTFDDYVRKSEGDDLTLECTISGSPTPQVTWTIDNKPVENSESIYENGKCRFVIPSLSESHSGNVRCTAKNSAGEVKQDGRIFIRAKRAGPSFVSDLPADLEVNEGQEATIQCEVKGHPQPRVAWTRDGRSLSVLSAETSYENGIASVRIRKASTHDGGRYVCSARNISAEVSSECNIKVIKVNLDEPPVFSKPLQNLTILDGTDLRLSCSVIGKPTPIVSWFLDGQKVLPEDGEATYKDNIATLVLEDAMPEDSGKYECLATNAAGESRSSCKVTVEVKSPPKEVEEGPSFPVQLEDITVKEGSDIILKCRVEGKPRPAIKWLLDGDPVTEADMKYAEDGTAELVLQEALPEDEGCYTCIAENTKGRVMCSCAVTVKVPPKVSKKRMDKQLLVTEEFAPVEEEVIQHESEDESSSYSTPERKPQVTEHLKNIVVPDGSINYRMTCRVSGTPPPQARWFVNGTLMEESDDFKFESEGDVRSVIFSEIFPDDTGEYMCVLSNAAGEDITKCQMNVEEIDGEPPKFLVKPRPLTVNAEETATFSCKVSGYPQPELIWLYCNNPITKSDRVSIETPNDDNNNLHVLNVVDSKIEDAGRYAACAKNLLGDVTCTVSLIVNAAKNVEAQKDFRNVLKKSNSTPKSPKSPEPSGDQVDFRGVLKRQVDTPKKDAASAKQEDFSQTSFRDVLKTSSNTKVLSEEERKKQKAGQKDFRGTLVRKVDTKVQPNEMLRMKSPEQKDFRDEALKTRVQTKAYDEDAVKKKKAEQKDFRDEALKNKVVTKAYKEEFVKSKRADQVDFRDVLSPTKRTVIDFDEEVSTATVAKEPVATPSNATTGKLKITLDKSDHNTVATKRTRHRGGAEKPIEKQSTKEEIINKPIFKSKLRSVTVADGQPFELSCTVVGNPRPDVTWYLSEEEIVAESGITITHQGDFCKLTIAESFPDDEGSYTCRAKNEHGVVSSTANVTVIGGGKDEE